MKTPEVSVEDSIKKLATAVVAAILASVNVNGASDSKTAVQAAKEYVNEAWK